MTLRAQLRPLAPGLTVRTVLEKFAAIQMVDVHFPTTDGRELIFSALHPTGEGSEDVAVPIGLGVTCTAPAADHGQRRSAERLSKDGILVQTF